MGATVITTPTEAEIRAEIEACATSHANHGRDRLGEAIMEYVDSIRYDPGTGDDSPLGEAIWTDLRPSEVLRLQELLCDAERRATQGAHELSIREYVAAALTFAAECPDAPRPPKLAASLAASPANTGA
jgi:hypothetical protein